MACPDTVKILKQSKIIFFLINVRFIFGQKSKFWSKIVEIGNFNGLVFRFTDSEFQIFGSRLNIDSSKFQHFQQIFFEIGHKRCSFRRKFFTRFFDQIMRISSSVSEVKAIYTQRPNDRNRKNTFELIDNAIRFFKNPAIFWLPDWSKISQSGKSKQILHLVFPLFFPWVHHFKPLATPSTNMQIGLILWSRAKKRLTNIW